jgi:phosphopantothenoylcysteine decarboxylase/phosphopantothenate--cysteine ligase
MATAVGAALAGGADWLFMSAAVADFTPTHIESGKLKKESLGTSWSLQMTRAVDILTDVVNPDRHEGLRIVGFALETEDLIRRATEKMRAKGMDFIIANDTTTPDSAFGAGEHCITLIGLDGVLWDSGPASKHELARGIFARLAPAAQATGAGA